MKKLNLLLYNSLFIVYQEIIFSCLIYKTVKISILAILFSISIAIFLTIISSLFNLKLNKLIEYIIVTLITILFGIQIIYYSMYESILSVYSIINGKQVLEFMNVIIAEILKNWYGLILFTLPIIALIILDNKKVIEFKKQSYKEIIINVTTLVTVQVIAILLISFVNTETIYSNKNLYYNIHVPKLAAKNMGLLTTMRLDLQRYILGFKENINIENFSTYKSGENDEEYNVTDINFDALSENEEDELINEIHEYLKNQEPSKKNEYTGMFEGKNIITIIGESFSDLAIREDLTPNLYRLYNEGFQFENFYTPIFPVSTADGEYIIDTSLIPEEGIWSFREIVDNYIPYSYANVFEKLGYTSNAYHNHTATFYERDKYIEAMGYDTFLAKNTGLETRMNTDMWPESDYEMFKVTIDDYINNDKFLAYYMTVSGHLNYTKEDNAMVAKNWDMVKDLPYSEKTKGYLAANIELDKGIGELLNRLEDAGKLEDTVIILTGDHYPYGLSLSEINELSTYKRDDKFEKYKTSLLIWSGSMDEPIKVEKIGSNLDVLPTVLNLFGVKYDSRLLMGRDILSDSAPLVIFSDRSFITDKGKYNSVTGEFIPKTRNIEKDEKYIEKISKIVYEKYKMSILILENNYYRKIFK